MKEFELIKVAKSAMSEVAQVFKASRAQALPNLPHLHSIDEDISYFTEVVFEENEVYAERSRETQEMFGFIAFSTNWVNHLYILPMAARTGIGSRLLDLAKKRAQTLELWTFQSNVNALRFYEKHGFIKVRETDGDGNEEKEPDVLLRWTKVGR